jgi:CubicO group peptidase (beta-lactamase class C family)
LFLFPFSTAWCGGLEGTWQGLLNVGFVKFRVALVVQKGPQGKPAVFFNNIDDGLYDEPVALLQAKDHSLKALLKKGQTLWLRLNPQNDRLEGTYLQSNGNFEKEGRSSPFTLVTGNDYLVPRLNSQGQSVTAYAYHPPLAEKGWETGSLPESATRSVERGIQKILNGTYPHIHGIVVVQGDKLLLNETFYGYSCLDPHPVQSITKSVFSLLFGIAQDQHLVRTNQKLYDYFPSYRSQKNWNPKKNRISLADLLTMSSGFDCFDWKDAQACSWGMVNSDDWLDFTLSKPLVQEPGSHFAYCGGCLLPLSVILERSSGLNIPQFAQKYLFDPLDIHSAQWVKAPSAGITVVPVSFGLSLSQLDLAKIGLLILHHGQWDGRQIVSKDWINESTSRKVSKEQTNKKYNYGYLWWETEMKDEGQNLNVVMGWGVGGNYLFIVPDKNMVCVITGGNYNDPKAAKSSLQLFQDHVLPILK